MKQPCCRKLLLAIQAVSAIGDHAVKKNAQTLLGFFPLHPGRVNPHISEGKNNQEKDILTA